MPDNKSRRKPLVLSDADSKALNEDIVRMQQEEALIKLLVTLEISYPQVKSQISFMSHERDFKKIKDHKEGTADFTLNIKKDEQASEHMDLILNLILLRDGITQYTKTGDLKFLVEIEKQMEQLLDPQFVQSQASKSDIGEAFHEDINYLKTSLDKLRDVAKDLDLFQKIDDAVEKTHKRVSPRRGGG